MHQTDDTPDRRYWTAYDYYMARADTRALRRAERRTKVRNVLRPFLDRVVLALKHAGAQPPRTQRRAA